MNVHKFLSSFLDRLAERMKRHLFDIENVEFIENTGYKVGHEPPKDGWRPYDAIAPLVGDDTHFWFRASFKTPEVGEGEYLILRAGTGGRGHWDLTNPQGLVYLGGEMVHALDYGHTEFKIEGGKNFDLLNYFNMGMYKGGKLFLKMSVLSVSLAVEKLYYDMKVPYDAAMLLPEGNGDREKMLSVLASAARIVDLREGASDEFYKSVDEAILYMEREFYGKLCTTEGKPTVHCIGSTHIDVEWLWARDQTREKIQRSFANVKSLMDQYPEFNFTLSQPELYRYLKEEAPDKYAELKALVEEGRWEPEGAMYLEPDCNLTSGESLVRQLLFGKKFFRDEFSKESRVLYLPDVFGYSAALPQILKKSGVDYFVTSKISWNDTNMMPDEVFYWEGIDGTEIFTSFMTAQPFGGYKNGERKKEATYNSDLTASYVKGTWDRFSDKEYLDNVFMTFGYGDGGGGPTRSMLETQRRTARGIPTLPVTKTDKLLPYLEGVKKEFDASVKRTGRCPRWVGELYLEFHRGTYTSIAKVKKNNRFSELTLGSLEALASLDKLFGGEYCAEGLTECWRQVLHNQFHDILPGSSIKKVYDYTDEDYRKIREYTGEKIGEKLSHIASLVKAGTLLYNPTGFERPAIVKGEGFSELPATVPAYGYAVVNCAPVKSSVKVSGNTVENDYYILTLNENGEIASLYDKRVGREALTGTGNVLVAYEDYPTEYDAWELADYYKLKAHPLSGGVKITPIIDGTRAGFVIERDYMSSKIKETMWLYSVSARIDFECDIDWHERHQILKAEFPLNVHASNAVYDVQFGHLTRPTHSNTTWDKAKFEVYGHKWADMSEHGYGVALMSDAKYGYSAEGNKMTLSLLKCATDPNPEADQGRHEFTYSLMPHEGDFRSGRVIEESTFLNQPLYEMKADGDGSLPERYSLVSADRSNVVITAVKQAEESDALVVRFYDAYDMKSTATITVPKEYKRACLADLMERDITEIKIEDGKFTVPVSNFEIITVKLYK